MPVPLRNVTVITIQYTVMYRNYSMFSGQGCFQCSTQMTLTVQPSELNLWTHLWPSPKTVLLETGSLSQRVKKLLLIWSQRSFWEKSPLSHFSISTSLNQLQLNFPQSIPIAFTVSWTSTWLSVCVYVCVYYFIYHTSIIWRVLL